ncbi:MAG: hypothetical protein KOO62_03325 [candidate division Zixibacteria bacterium]|nr:hypothetical protein [candidate division Zixibacteria bacterium]
MRSFRFLLTVSLLGLVIVSSVVAITPERQREIIENYMYVTGQLDERPGQALTDANGDPVPIKCGMSAIADFVLNRDKLDDGLMKSLGVQIIDRDTLIQNELTYASPGGYFLIHYTVTGQDSVYEASVDISPANGIPDYVDGVAMVGDSVYNHIVNTLGYAAPPADGFYTDGDDRYDVYLRDIGTGVYGQTWMDSTQIDGPGTLRSTSFIDLDNDYQSLSAYKDRPMDAVRVTMAHEFFHAIQFGYDFSEAESYPNDIVGRYWMEMSAVWMEEEIYDEINDFYYYLPWFFDDPSSSIQQFDSYGDLHPYASAIYPMYLSETYGRDIIKDIWEQCGTMGMGASFLKATHNAVLAASGNTAGWASAFRDFSLWNFFTGSRATMAPPGYGYSERLNFPAFPDDKLAIHTSYEPPVFIPSNGNPFKPCHNGAAIIILDYPGLAAREDTTHYVCDVFDCIDSTEVQGYEDYDMRYLDTITCERSFWVCNEDIGSVCFDSSVVPRDSLYDFLHVDSMLDIHLALGDGLCAGEETFPLPWGLSIVYRLVDNPNQYEIDRILLPDDIVTDMAIPFPDSFLSIGLILTAATYEETYYQPRNPLHRIDLGYWIEDQQTDTAAPDLPNAVLTPYPNPAVVGSMTAAGITFRFQIATDSLGVPLFGKVYLSGDDRQLPPYLSVNIYNVAGERVKTLGGYSETGALPHHGEWEIEWDMKNQAGNDVASGVYVAYARLYSSEDRKTQLAEEFTKVVVIR